MFRIDYKLERGYRMNTPQEGVHMSENNQMLEWKAKSVHGYALLVIPELLHDNGKEYVLGFRLYREVDLVFVGTLSVRDATESLMRCMERDGFRKSRGKSAGIYKWWRRIVK
jgi:hypothetical protein